MGQELKARTGGQLDRVRDSPASKRLRRYQKIYTNSGPVSHWSLWAPSALFSCSHHPAEPCLWGLLHPCWVLVPVSGKPCADLTVMALGPARSQDCAIIGTRCYIPNTSLCLTVLQRRTKTIWDTERKCKQASCLTDSPSTEWTTCQVGMPASGWQADFWPRYTTVLCSHITRTEV